MLPFEIYNSFAASGESTIAIPSVASKLPKIITSMLIFVWGFVTTTISPGKYPGDFANNPLGNSPASATTALPSKDGLEAPIKKIQNNTEQINKHIFFIGLLPYFPFKFKLILSAISQANLLNPTYWLETDSLFGRISPLL